jgi:hypothetical protein
MQSSSVPVQKVRPIEGIPVLGQAVLLNYFLRKK